MKKVVLFQTNVTGDDWDDCLPFEKETALKAAKRTVAFFNSTLKPGEKPRKVTKAKFGLKEEFGKNLTAFYEGSYTRLYCNSCMETFYVEDDCQNGDEVKCEGCEEIITVDR